MTRIRIIMRLCNSVIPVEIQATGKISDAQGPDLLIC